MAVFALNLGYDRSVIFPLACKNFFVCIYVGTISFLLIIIPLSFILCSVCICMNARSCLFAISKLANIFSSTLISVSGIFVLLFVVQPLTFVDVPILIKHFSSSLSDTFFPCSDIVLIIWVVILALSMEHIVWKISLVPHFIFELVFAFAFFFTSLPWADIVVLIWVNHSTFSCYIIVAEVTIVNSAIWHN